ncbi:RagB/SusD family nutrient uptake outer membrane protein [Flavihumibacter petaseus]|uniref:RagB/SusD domain-containing protein n=1 Tax=Flavihumibacter petaseus NBRC 106054 TaxID=1220578 RepID=A0A0E9N0V4_9BACT|nr:RagB/SusD family nutrient uptake outer membrane protein [Flavihumibacter petaseus]GAO43642.1 hypothetical protein FPE01S_02_07480 [Flavihumibacter petaseus NBRC 106054]
MKRINLPISFFAFLVVATSVMPGCKKDFSNPNAAPEDEVFTSARGMTAVGVGLQRKYSYSRAGDVYNIVTANGFTTNELLLMNAGNTAEAQLSVGGTAVDPTNTILANIWANGSKIILDANRIITAAPTITDPNYVSALTGYATIFKAQALGSLAMFWEKVPDTSGILQVTFSDRMLGYQRAIASIDKALALIAADSISANFALNIPPGTNIKQTLLALKARYAVFSGDWDNALAAANAVDLTVKSTMNFDGASPNPIFETATATNNVYQVIDSTFGLPEGLRPENSDKRVQFYTLLNTQLSPDKPVPPRFRINGFGVATATSYPYYVPGEMTLIKAEVYARKNQLPDAIAEINKIRTKKAADDPFGIGADESPYAGAVTQDAVLTEIYRQRCIELYMQGFKLEDSRRFDRPIAEKKRNFFPYPFAERDNNSNTPPDPLF